MFLPLLIECELSPALLLQLATGLDWLDLPTHSLAAVRKALAQQPDNAQAYYDLGYYSARCGAPPHLVESLARRAIALAPERMQFRVGLTALLLKHDRRSDAHAVVCSLTQEQIREIHCRRCLARTRELFEEAGDWQRVAWCQEQLERLPATQPEDAC